MNKALPPLTKLKNLPPLKREDSVLIFMNCGTGPSTLSQWQVPWPTPPNFSSVTHLSWVKLHDPPSWGGGRGGVWGVWRRDILDSLPSVRVTSPVQTTSSEQQHSFALKPSQPILVANGARARSIGQSVKICFEDVHPLGNLLDASWGESTKYVQLLNV